MLGTGIASAQENVNPDTPPSTIDGGVTVPIDIEQNSFNTPEGQRELPEFHGDVVSDQATSANPLIRNPADRFEADHATRGNADSVARNQASPRAGTTRPGVDSVPAWTETSGNPATLAAQPQFAGVGNSSADSSTVNQSRLSGFTSTNGKDSTLSGNLADAPVALPFTAAPAGAVDVCGDAAGADALCVNDVTSTGTTGNDSLLSGNIAQISAAVPAEAYGLTGGAVGSVPSTTAETKVVEAGGTSNSDDDNGVVSSNVVTAPTAVGAQAFSDAVALVGNPTTDTTVTAGGPAEATGHHGPVSGDIFEVPNSNPVQAFGDTVVGVGNGSSDVDSAVSSTSGGDAVGDGVEDVIAGTVAPIPEASAIQVFDDAVTAVANGRPESPNDTETTGSGRLTSYDVSAPAEIAGQVYDVPVEVLGTSVGNVYTKTTQLTAEETEAANLARGVQLPASIDSLLASTDVPGLRGLGNLPAQRSAPAPRIDEIPATSIPYAPMLGGVPIPADVLDTALRAVVAQSAPLTAEETEAANLARGVQLSKSIDSLLTSTDVPNLTALTAERGPLNPRLPQLPEAQLPEAHLSDTPTLGGVPVPVGPSVRQVSEGVHTVNHADLSMPVGPEISGGGVALTNDRLPVEPQFAVDRATDVAGLSRMTLPKGSYFDKVSDTTGSDVPGQTEHAVNTVSDTAAETSLPVPHQHVNLTEERSFSGSLPADSNFGTVPVLRSLNPVGSSGRNLTSTPTLPVSAPSLPVVLPVVPISQPRAVSDGIPLNDVQINPTSSYLETPDLPIWNRRSYPAPALAGLDTKTMFGSLDDTLQFERIS